MREVAQPIALQRFDLQKVTAINSGLFPETHQKGITQRLGDHPQKKNEEQQLNLW